MLDVHSHGTCGGVAHVCWLYDSVCVLGMTMMRFVTVLVICTIALFVFDVGDIHSYMC